MHLLPQFRVSWLDSSHVHLEPFWNLVFRTVLGYSWKMRSICDLCKIRQNGSKNCPPQQLRETELQQKGVQEKQLTASTRT